jgi:hypothetical protein
MVLDEAFQMGNLNLVQNITAHLIAGLLGGTLGVVSDFHGVHGALRISSGRADNLRG